MCRRTTRKEGLLGLEQETDLLEGGDTPVGVALAAGGVERDCRPERLIQLAQRQRTWHAEAAEAVDDPRAVFPHLTRV